MKCKANLPTHSPIVVLVRPQLAENMGMVARAMMNCGLSQLRLVLPKQDHLSASAISSASGAQMILKEAKTYNTLEDALSDVHYVIATTARVRGMDKIVYTPEKAVLKIKEKINQKQQVALLFGPERTGLENEDIIFADALLIIPLNPIHSSLNLAQAVLLTGWIWWQENLKQFKKSVKISAQAPKKELNFFLNFLIQHLENKNYFTIKNKKEKMQQNLKNIFTKSALTSAEIKTLYRVVKRLLGERKK